MSRGYHKIYAGKKHRGFVAPTIDMPGVWSIYNAERKKVAMVAPDGGQFNMMFYGKHASTTEYFMANSFPAAVQRAFKLGEPPLFMPTLPPEVLDPMGAALGELGDSGAEASTVQHDSAEGIEGYLDGLLAGQESSRSKLYLLDLVISKARALRLKLM